MPDKQITAFIADILRFGLERLSLVPADKRSFEVQDAIAAQELAVDVLSSIGAVDSTPPSTSVIEEIETVPAVEDGITADQNVPTERPSIEESDISENQHWNRAVVLARSIGMGGSPRKENKPDKQNLNAIASHLPHELLLHIFEWVDELPTLYSCSLVSRYWNPVAQEVLWREVLLDNAPRLRRFVRGVAFSATPRVARRSARTRAGLVPKNFGEVPKAFEELGELIKPGLMNIANGASRRFGVGSKPTTLTPSEGETHPAMLKVIAERPPLVINKPPVGRLCGLGSMVKKLVVSSSEQKVILLQHVSNLLNNLQSLQFQHLNIEGSGPSLDARILNSLETLIDRVCSLTIEDVDSPCWPDLCRILREHGGRLRNLNIEAVSEIDAFESSSDLSDVFPSMPGLEFVRLDGIPVGPNASIERLVSSCGCLQAVTLDYCLDVTMDILMVLWNGCPQLNFLGLAGVVGPLSSPLQLEQRPSLKTLRLVDCDVSDEMFEEMALKATGLEMLRLVFEDDGCEGIVTVSNELTDRTLDALSTHSTTLRIVALTRCPNMTAKALSRVIRNNPVSTLDLHKHPDCSIGGVDDKFLRELGTSVKKVRVLNLYGQLDLTEQCIVEVARNGAWTGLRSLSLNNLTVGPSVLDTLRVGCPALEVLSLVDCPKIAAEAIRGFVEGVSVAHMRVIEEVSGRSDKSDVDTESSVGASSGEGSGSSSEPAKEILPTPSSTSADVASVPGPGATASSSSSLPPSPSPLSSAHLHRRFPIRTLPSFDSPPAPPSPLRKLRRVYTLALDTEETSVVKRRDAWFVDEGLDILSLWENAVRGLAGRGWVF
ncbi:uncharacterized protein SPPG_04698 [Spizellomyces punctatus DAOM BR117]|uniref:F-box domain-containing protein n=1 Tax=Spizellomyces punctatus (strain DAOM BR117) TaxID=645134 RepID=A0A0L0HHS7_SPIPD|nr:uncharacterized protein SPPG_04698 [Spizellomyces punctatus DAOM BR117]KND00374.1 hypothetical protein SPPG_04698 [Spizellomyces punctatus DAOM BR117]|eukprot:XP_016608413.1 hypothetical protein SPPG_04698 [Spizellomyces punctatus DAOM BR117]